VETDMSKFSHWMVVESFRWNEAACLIAGVDPGDGSGPLNAKAIPMVNRVRDAYDEARRSHIGEISNQTDEHTMDRPQLAPVHLQSIAMLKRQGDDAHRFHAWLTSRFADIDRQRFSRQEIMRWLRVINVAPGFNFGPIATATERPMEARERKTLLNIIGVLLELIQTPTGKRDSAAAVIDEMLANYSDKQGIAKRTIEEKFAAANESLRTDR
jgi:hypothetical protein